jgi:hypothetical protein
VPVRFRPSRRARLAFLLLFAALLSASWAAGCASAPSSEEGGDPRFDTSPGETVEGDACAPTGDAGSGTGWSDLYRDYFGPTGVASCAGSPGQCHGDTQGLGYQSSQYLCANGVQGCYQGITSAQADLVTVGDTKDDPRLSTLYGVLRKSCPAGGTMPLQPSTLVFSPADMARIAAWIGAGAPNN